MNLIGISIVPIIVMVLCVELFKSTKIKSEKSNIDKRYLFINIK